MLRTISHSIKGTLFILLALASTSILTGCGSDGPSPLGPSITAEERVSTPGKPVVSQEKDQQTKNAAPDAPFEANPAIEAEYETNE